MFIFSCRWQQHRKINILFKVMHTYPAGTEMKALNIKRPEVISLKLSRVPRTKSNLLACLWSTFPFWDASISPLRMCYGRDPRHIKVRIEPSQGAYTIILSPSPPSTRCAHLPDAGDRHGSGTVENAFFFVPILIVASNKKTPGESRWVTCIFFSLRISLQLIPTLLLALKWNWKKKWQYWFLKNVSCFRYIAAIAVSIWLCHLSFVTEIQSSSM